MKLILLSLSLSALGTTFAFAGSGTPEPHTQSAAPATDWLTGEGVSLGGVLFPHAHFQSVYGATTADDVEHFNAGHHDPAQDGWTIQGFEFGASLRPLDWFEAFSTYHLFLDAETDEWEGEFEEWFGKIKNLPGGFELRGGRYLTRFGLQNSTHLHGWDYVDNNLVNGRFLGDDGLYTIGGEITWTLPVSWTSLLSVNVGVAPEHEHEHGEEHEGHEHEEALYEAEGALFTETFVAANWTNQLDYNDFHQFRFGGSGAWGDNEFGKGSQVYGVHFEYLWRENGYESGGSYFRWRTEALLRHSDAISGGHDQEDEHHEEEHDHHAEAHEEEHHNEAGSNRASFTELGLYTMVAYGFENGLELGMRGEYVEGVAEAGLDERFRLSPVATYYFNAKRTLYVRAQQNYDHSSDFGDEQSVWMQVGFNWGGGEVR
jgi:hypothetical protein